MTEEIQTQILHEDIQKIDVTNGDVLLVTLPKSSSNLSSEMQSKFAVEVSKSFKEVFKDKQLKVVVVPYGMTVELIKGEDLVDKDDV